MANYYNISINRATACATLSENFNTVEVVYHAFIGHSEVDEYYSSDSAASETRMRRLIKRNARRGGWGGMSDARNFVERIKLY